MSLEPGKFQNNQAFRRSWGRRSSTWPLYWDINLRATEPNIRRLKAVRPWVLRQTRWALNFLASLAMARAGWLDSTTLASMLLPLRDFTTLASCFWATAAARLLA